MLIGVVGLIGSGKGTVSDRLVEKHGYQKDSFAKSLKDAVASMFNWDRALLEGDTNASRQWREQPDAYWSEKFGKPTTPRWVLQYFGTEVMRGQMYDGIWVDSCILIGSLITPRATSNPKAYTVQNMRGPKKSLISLLRTTVQKKNYMPRLTT